MLGHTLRKHRKMRIPRTRTRVIPRRKTSLAVVTRQRRKRKRRRRNQRT